MNEGSAGHLQKGPIGCTETPVTNCRPTLRNIPEERISGVMSWYTGVPLWHTVSWYTECHCDTLWADIQNATATHCELIYRVPLRYTVSWYTGCHCDTLSWYTGCHWDTVSWYTGCHWDTLWADIQGATATHCELIYRVPLWHCELIYKVPLRHTVSWYTECHCDTMWADIQGATATHCSWYTGCHCDT